MLLCNGPTPWQCTQGCLVWTAVIMQYFIRGLFRVDSFSSQSTGQTRTIWQGNNNRSHVGTSKNNCKKSVVDKWVGSIGNKNTTSSAADYRRGIEGESGRNGTKGARAKLADIAPSPIDQGRTRKAGGTIVTANVARCVGYFTSGIGGTKGHSINGGNNKEISGILHSNVVEDEPDGTTNGRVVIEESEAREPILCYTRPQ